MKQQPYMYASSVYTSRESQVTHHAEAPSCCQHPCRNIMSRFTCSLTSTASEAAQRMQPSCSARLGRTLPRAARVWQGEPQGHSAAQTPVPHAAEGTAQSAAVLSTPLEPADSRALHTAREQSEQGPPSAAQVLHEQAQGRVSEGCPLVDAAEPAAAADPAAGSAKPSTIRAKAGSFSARALRSQSAAGDGHAAQRPWR